MLYVRDKFSPNHRLEGTSYFFDFTGVDMPTMRPFIYVNRGLDHYGPFGKNPAPPGKRVHIGYINPSDEEWINPAWIYQVHTNRSWSASRWDIIPDDGLWTLFGPNETFYTYVESSDLDFRNTPLEHRYILSTLYNYNAEIHILAENEKLLWEGEGKTFIPFKRPYPQGYQGVWITVNACPGDMHVIISVNDSFSPSHLLEMD